MSPAEKAALEISDALKHGRARGQFAPSVIAPQPAALEPYYEPEPRWVTAYLVAGLAVALLVLAALWFTSIPERPNQGFPSSGVESGGHPVPGAPPPSGPGTVLLRQVDEMGARLVAGRFSEAELWRWTLVADERRAR